MGKDKGKSNTDRLGTDRIPHLLLRLSIPSTIGLVVSASYNLVDTFFVGHFGVTAITALTIVFPLQMVLTALAQGTGIGSQSYISRMLGRGKTAEASHAASTSLILAFLFWVVTVGIGLFFMDDIIRIFTADPEVISFGVAYAKIIFLGSFALFFLRAALNILRAQGNYLLPMIILIVTASLNIVLDPILIFGMFGIPAFGVEGAAIATVGSRIIGCVLIAYILFSHHNEVRFKIRRFRFNAGVVSRIFSVGAPTIMIDLVLGITLAGTNKILDGVAMATVLIAGAGIYFRLQSIILTPVLGLSRSLIPIIGYNYGAEKFGRVWETLRVALVFSLFVSLIAFLLFELFPGYLIGFFNSDVQLITQGSLAFQRMSIIGGVIIYFDVRRLKLAKAIPWIRYRESE
jgi:putative MATE family efflux protein